MEKNKRLQRLIFPINSMQKREIKKKKNVNKVASASVLASQGTIFVTL